MYTGEEAEEVVAGWKRVFWVVLGVLGLTGFSTIAGLGWYLHIEGRGGDIHLGAGHFVGNAVPGTTKHEGTEFVGTLAGHQVCILVLLLEVKVDLGLLHSGDLGSLDVEPAAVVAGLWHIIGGGGIVSVFGVLEITLDLVDDDIVGAHAPLCFVTQASRAIPFRSK